MSKIKDKVANAGRAAVETAKEVGHKVAGGRQGRRLCEGKDRPRRQGRVHVRHQGAHGRDRILRQEDREIAAIEANEVAIALAGIEEEFNIFFASERLFNRHARYVCDADSF